MTDTFVNLQLELNNILGSLSNTYFFIVLAVEVTLTYLQNDFWTDFNELRWASNLLNAWFTPLKDESLYNCTIQDELAYIWLYKHGNIFEGVVWASYHIEFLKLKSLVASIATLTAAKTTLLMVRLPTYLVSILIQVVEYSFFVLIFLNLILYSKVSLKGLISTNSYFYAKFSYLVESEEELGATDDVLLFVSFFIILFGWFFLSLLIFANVYTTSINFVGVGFLTLIFFVLLIPTGLLVDFGINFASYIRGAGGSTNIIVEVLFDLIGTLVVFTRFIVQNIRFVLIFWAYFELFEWVYASPFTQLLESIVSFDVNKNIFLWYNSQQNGYYYFILIIAGLIGYSYYFLHLLILLFIQLGAYFLISFWLFFFFYTSFYLTKTEKLFFYKRYLN